MELVAKLEAQEAREGARAHVLAGDSTTHADSAAVSERRSKLLSDAGIARVELAWVTGLSVGAVDELCRGRRKHVDA